MGISSMQCYFIVVEAKRSLRRRSIDFRVSLKGQNLVTSIAFRMYI